MTRTGDTKPATETASSPSDGPSEDWVRRFAAMDGAAITQDAVLAPTLAATAQHTGPVSAPAGLERPGRYHFKEVFARGGLGQIRRAYDRLLQRDVAVKEMVDYRPGSPAEARFWREALLAARLEHPAIVPVQDMGRHESGEPYFCMKLVDGRTLDLLVKERSSLYERLGLLAHVIAVAEALAYAHQRGIIHRDLKPSNVLVGAFGETVVIDWGLAREIEAEEVESARGQASELREATGDLTRTGEIVGTLMYMPREQAEGHKLGPTADVYSLGAILYFVLCGRPPYEAKTAAGLLNALLQGPPPALRTRVDGLAADLFAIVDKAMARDPADRYPDARGLAADLRRFQAGRMITARTYSPLGMVRHFIGRHRIVAGISAVAVSVVAGVGWFSYAQIDESDRAAAAARSAAAAERATAEREHDIAETRSAELEQVEWRRLVEQGRQELATQHRPIEALRSLLPAYAARPDDRGLRRMIAEAMRPIDALEQELDGHVGGALFAEFVKGRIVTRAVDGSVTLREGDTGEVAAVLTAAGGTVEDVAIDRRQGLVWVLSTGRLEAFDAASGARRHSMSVTPSGTSALAPDGQVLLELSEDLVRMHPLVEGVPVVVRAKDVQMPQLPVLGDRGGFTLHSPHFTESGWVLPMPRAGGGLAMWTHAGARTGPVTTHRQSVLAISRSGRTAIVRDVEDQTLSFWHVEQDRHVKLQACSGDPQIVLADSCAADRTCVLAPQEDLFVAAGEGRLRAWEAGYGACLPIEGADESSGALFSLGDGDPEGFIASAGTDGVLDVFATTWNDFAPTALRRELGLPAHARAIHHIGYDDASGRLLTASADGTVRVWHARRALPRVLARAMNVEQSPSHTKLYSWRRAAGGRFGANFDVVTFPELRPLSSFALPPDTHSVQWAAGDALLLRRREVFELRGEQGELRGRVRHADTYEWPLVLAQYLPRSDQLVVSGVPTSGQEQFMVSLWDLRTGDEVFGARHSGFPGEYDVSEDGSRLFLPDPAVAVDPRGGSPGVVLNGSPLASARLAPDQRFVFVAAGGSEERESIDVHDVASGARLERLFESEAPTGEVPGEVMLLSPDHERLVTARADGTLDVWAYPSLTHSHGLRGHTGQVQKARFSDDGTRLVSLGADGQLRVWDVDDGRELASFHATESEAPAILAVFHPHEPLLVAATGGDVLRMIDTETGESLWTRPLGLPLDLTFNARGDTLYSQHGAVTRSGRPWTQLWIAHSVPSSERRTPGELAAIVSARIPGWKQR